MKKRYVYRVYRFICLHLMHFALDPDNENET